MKEKSLKLSDRSKSNANSKQSTKKDTASKHAKCVDDGIRYKLAPKKTKSITGMTVTKKTSPSKRQRNAQAEKKTKEQRKSCANISRKNSEVESSENKRLSLPSSDPIIWVRRRRDGVTSAELKVSHCQLPYLIIKDLTR